jgi:hypothetical protein
MPDESQQPKYIEKRVRYFDGQYLNVDDFINEQQYHIDRQRRMSRLLCVSGILEGLEVTVEGNNLKISPGAAIDDQGRQILLNSQLTIDLTKYDESKKKLLLSFKEQESDLQDGGQNTRFQEVPNVFWESTKTSSSVLLAILSKDGSNFIPNLDDRQYSGLQLPAKDGKGVTLTSQNGASDRAELKGSLSISGNVGIGESDPSAKLEVVQKGTENAAVFKGGGGVDIIGVNENQSALYINSKANGFSALNIDMDGKSSAAWIKSNNKENTGYPALTIDMDGKGHAAWIKSKNKENTDYSALVVDMEGKSYAAWIKSNNTANGSPALSVLQKGIGSVVSVKNDNKQSTESALYVEQQGTGNAAYFKGGAGVYIEKDLTVQGTSTLTGSLTVNNTVSLKGSANASGLTVDASGNVGINTNSISFGALKRQMINLWNTDYGIGIQNETQYFRTGKNFAWYKNGIHNDSELNSGNGGVVQMVIKDGNVGIGTIRPSEKLEVGDFGTQSNNYIQIKTCGGNNYKAGIKLRVHDDNIGFTIENNDNVNSTGYGLNILRHDSDPNGSSALFINRKNGNVGIDKIDPSEKLEINGNLKVNGVLIGNAGNNGTGGAIREMWGPCKIAFDIDSRGKLDIYVDFSDGNGYQKKFHLE